MISVPVTAEVICKLMSTIDDMPHTVTFWKGESKVCP
jgi:hypothetical protein